MNIQYKGNNFLEFIGELKKLNIPEVNITFIEDLVYCKVPGNF